MADEMVTDGVDGVRTTRMLEKAVRRGIELEPNYCAVILERMATAFPALEIRQV